MSDWLGGIGDAFSSAGSWLGNNASWLLPVAGMGASIFANQNAARTQSNALQQAANTQLAGQTNATNALTAMYSQSRADAAPYRAAGNAALGVMTPYVTGGFQADPGYQFRLQQGAQAVNNSAAARGMLGSGATLKALQDYGQGQASQEYGNWWNRAASLAGLGQTANAQGAAAGTSAGNGLAQVYGGTANGLAGIYGQMGTVGANAGTAMANNINSGINNALKYWAGQ